MASRLAILDPVKSIKADKIPLLLLSVMILVYVLKFFHSGFILQTDVYLNLLLWHHSDWIEPNWDPISLGYSGWYPISGKLFPSVLFLRAVGKFFFPDSLEASLTLLLIQSAFAFSLYVFAIYGFLRYLRVSPWGALLGTIGAGFGGFIPYSGLRETNFFYSTSAAAWLAIVITLHRAHRERAIYWTVVSGLVMGLSLLGGSNFPLFVYLPCLPFVWLIDEKPEFRSAFSNSFKCALRGLVAGFLGLGIAGFHLLPGLAYLNESNRPVAVKSFNNPFPHVTLEQLFVMLTTTNEPNPNYKLWVCPVLFIFLGLGLIHRRRARFGLGFVYFSLAYIAICLSVSWLPKNWHWIGHGFQEIFSLRFIGVRFAFFFLVFVGYFVGRGWDSLLPRWRFANSLCVLSVFAVYWLNNRDIPLYNRSALPLRENLQLLDTIPANVDPGTPHRVFQLPSRRAFWAYRHGIRMAFDPWFDSSSSRHLTRFANMALLIPYDLERQTFVGNEPPPSFMRWPSPLLELYGIEKWDYPYFLRDFVHAPPRPFPSVFWTPQARFFSSEGALFEALAIASRNDLASSVYLLGSSPSPIETPASQDAAIDLKRREREKWELEIHSPTSGFLNVSELWFPAWRAYLDGKPTSLMRGYGTFWTVAVPAGNHRIEFRYDEPWWKVGLALTLFSLISILTYLWRYRAFETNTSRVRTTAKPNGVSLYPGPVTAS